MKANNLMKWMKINDQLQTH